MATKRFEARSDLGESVLGKVNEYGAGIVDPEAPQSRRSGGDAESEVKPEVALEALGGPAQDADGLSRPELLDEPAFLGLLALEIACVCHGEVAGRRSVIHGQRTFRAETTCVESTTSASASCANSSALRARLSVARRLPRPIS